MTSIYESVLFCAGQRSLRRMTRWTAPLALVCCLAPVAHAQLTTADIVGTVTDATGAVIPGASITILNLDTQDKRVITSSASGEYQATLLPVGRYSITIKASGFKTYVTPSLAVEAGDRARSDASMQTGGSSETVTVEASTPLLQADNSTVSSTITAVAVQDLPLNGRNYVQLVQLVPGANEGPGNGLTSGGRPDDRRPTSSFSVNGQDDTLNNTTIDGIDDNERIIGTTGVKVDVEGIQEITVQTNSYAAEAGRTAGGVVSIITRSGTNKFHGTAYEYFRNDIFDAKSVLQQPGQAKPELRQNQFGGSIGGPIFKDRTFFFADYEGIRTVSGVTYQKTVPDQYEYDAINSLNGETPQTLIAAGAGTASYSIDAAALAYLKLFPAPNVAGCTTPTPTPAAGCLSNNHVISPNKTSFGNSYDVRIDHKFSDRNTFFGRFDSNKFNVFTPPGLGVVNGLQISGGRYDFDGPAIDSAKQFGFGFTHIFNQNLLLDLRAAYTRINNLSLPLNYGLTPDTTFGIANINYNATSSYLLPIGFGGFSDIGDGNYVPLQDIDNTFQYLANLSYTHGKHNVKGGVSYIRRQARNVQSAFGAGQYGFGLNTDTVAAPNGASAAVVTADQAKSNDNILASSLVGAFQSDSRNNDLSAPDYRTYEPSFFIQDNWKVLPKLTIQLGVRYDLFTPFTEAHNRISNFDFLGALADNNTNVSSALKIAGVNGVNSNAGIKTDYTNFAPRVGFSASLTPTTVLRGGYGISFFPGNYTSNADLKNAPFVSVYSPNCQSMRAYAIETSQPQNGGTTGQNPVCNGTTQPATFDAGLPLPVAPVTTNLASLPSQSYDAENPNFKSALIQQFNLQLEQQFGANVFTIGYVGNIGQHLPETINDINTPNPFNPDVNPSASARPLAAQFTPTGTTTNNLGGVSWLQSEGVSNYNALQTSFQRRLSKGLAFDANYTWGKAMSDITGFSAEGGGRSWGNANPRQIRQIDYGVAENDIQNRFAISLNYKLPFGNEFHGLKKAVLGGYQFNTIGVWQSGKPFDIVNGGGGVDITTETVQTATGPTTFSDNFSNRATPQNNGGPDRPNLIGNPKVGHSTVGPNGLFFNPAAFAPQPLGTIGSTKRDALFGPHFRHFDMSVFKDFAVTERLNLQFRAEAYNVSNTPSYYINDGSGNVQLGNSAFGTVTATDPNYNPRQFQFALKAQF